MKTFAAIWIAISGALFAGQASAGCRDLVFEDIGFTICESDPARDDIRLFLNDANDARLGTFDNVAGLLAGEGKQLNWAMNAGMYHADRAPVGLYIENGEEQARLITSDGPGNFGLLPNGLLCLTAGKARILESRAFAENGPACRDATQSGPMLVIDGALHPRFLPNSDSVFIRNGVGVTEDGRLIAAISNARVNFHRFARLFRDVLNTPNALFLDGNISRLYAPELNRHDLGFPMGPILGVAAASD